MVGEATMAESKVLPAASFVMPQSKCDMGFLILPNSADINGYESLVSQI